jgi:hypothetical protein
MSDQFRTDSFSALPPNISLRYKPLPPWLARRLLRAEETITWVRGPRFTPRWERYITHPGLFVLALLLGAVFLGVGRLVAGSWSKMPPLPFLVAGGLFIGSVYILALSNGYFTRLVVTNFRIVIMQGYEVCRSWRINDLPPSLIRYRGRDGERSPTVDLDTLQTMLGGGSDQFAESKTIRAFGKQLDQIKARDKDKAEQKDRTWIIRDEEDRSE